jgi:hypothetical protein
MDIGEIANRFEDLITAGKIQFIPAHPQTLDVFSQYVIEAFLTEQKLKWRLGSVKIEKAVCLKIDDPFLQYLDIYPEQQRYQWCTDNHRKGVMPDKAMTYLIERFLPGTKISIKPDGTLAINDNLRFKV